MDWTEIIISVDGKDSETAEAIAHMVVPYGIYIEDYSMLEDEVMEIAHIDLIDEELLKKDKSKVLIHVYISPEENPAENIAFLRERLSAEGVDSEINTLCCNEEDWRNNWRQYFYPIPVGEKLLIRPTWRDKYDAGDRKVIDIDPGLAFGTGNHETTRLCLTELEKHVTEGVKVLDVGCGSGILSIASVLLGAESAFGVDIDPTAVRTAKENAQLNGVADRCGFVSGNLTDKVEGTYNIVVANIVADAIIMLSKDVKKFMNEDSVYIMSGIIESRLPDVLSALEGSFKVIKALNDAGWVCLVAKAL
ncbi:MAG: 50S ribosomal protein L11 methyltransferase [Eubacteriales bacterium]|nr:50S ribosomal protein L11 methyltransferase [Eubacteriales bacterium]